MKIVKIIIVLLVSSSLFYVQAREGRSVSGSVIAAKVVLPEIKQNKDSMIENLKKENFSLKEKETGIKSANNDKDQEIKSKDAEIRLLKNHLIEDSIEIKRLKAKLNFADTVIARISNDCLRKKYDPVRVDEALVYFRKMYSPELRSKFSPLEKLLTQYSNYLKEISDIWSEAKNDPEIKNPFTGQKKALSYIAKIESTHYYKEVYNANWTIPYLNNEIDRVIKELKSFNPKVSRELKLSDKMN